MTLRRFTSIALAGAALAVAMPAHAGNRLIVAGQRVAVAGSALTVQPDGEWNRLAARPGRYAERWTRDGDQLDALTFYGGIADGKTLFREVDSKKSPLPRVAAAMLLPDIPSRSASRR
jgi:hypothetical protein